MTQRTLQTQRVARRAARRQTAAGILRESGRFLLIGSGLGLLGSVPMGIWVSPTAGFVTLGLCLGIAAAAGATVAWTRRPSLVGSAARVDEALLLHDRLSSALELAGPTGEDRAFVDLAVIDAERRATQVRVSQAVPVRATRDWLLWPLVSGAAVGAVLLLPPLVRGAMGPSAGELARTRESLVQAAKAVETPSVPQSQPDAADQAALDRLNDIERELSAGRRTPESARTESAAVLEDRARQLADEAEQERQSLRDAFNRLSSDPDSSVSELAEALRQGDFDGASEQLRQLARDAQAMSEEDRSKLASDLRKLSEQMEEAASEQQRVANDSTPNAQQVTPEASEGKTPDEPAQPVAEAEQPTEVRDAENTDRPEREPESSASAEQEDRSSSPTEDLSRSLSDVADQVEQQPESLQPDQPKPEPPKPEERQSNQTEQSPPDQPRDGTGEQQQGTQSQGQEGQQRDGQGQQPEQREAEPGTQASEPQQRQDPQQGEQQQGQQQQQGQEQTGQSESRPGEGDRQQVQGQRDQSQQNQQQGQTQQEGQPRQGTPQPGSSERPADPGNQQQQMQGSPGQQQQEDAVEQPGTLPRPGAQNQEGEPSTQPNERPDSAGQQPSPGQADGQEPIDESMQRQPGQGGDGLSRALDELEKMDRRQLESVQKLARSRQMQEAARDLLDEASPEDLQRLSELGRRLNAQQAFETQDAQDWNPQTELFDARGDSRLPDDRSRVVGEAERNDAEPAPTLARTNREALADRVREAAAGVERAIEGQAIAPQKRDYVRRVYQRLSERTSGTSVKEGRDSDAPRSDGE